MNVIPPEATVGDIVTRHPETLPVFERLGIDYCCGGGRCLGEAVAAAGLAWQDVSAQIGAAIAASAGSQAQPSWVDAPLTDLMGHIVGRYHGKLRELLLQPVVRNPALVGHKQEGGGPAPGRVEPHEVRSDVAFGENVGRGSGHGLRRVPVSVGGAVSQKSTGASTGRESR